MAGRREIPNWKLARKLDLKSESPVHKRSSSESIKGSYCSTRVISSARHSKIGWAGNLQRATSYFVQLHNRSKPQAPRAGGAHTLAAVNIEENIRVAGIAAGNSSRPLHKFTVSLSLSLSIRITMALVLSKYHGYIHINGTKPISSLSE